MYGSLIWQRFSGNNRKFLILVILPISFGFINIPVWAQLSPLPPVGFMAGQVTGTSVSREPGLLFYLSGNKGFTADFAAGDKVLPNYLKDVSIIPGGAQGPGFSAEDSQLMTYDDQLMDKDITERTVELDRGDIQNLLFAPHNYNLVSLELIEPNEKGYWERPDLGIGPDDIRIIGNLVTVRVHSLGSVAAPSTRLELKDATGKLAATATVPALHAPLDLLPSITEVTLTVPEGTDLSRGSVQIDPEGKIKQITRRNTIVKW